MTSIISALAILTWLGGVILAIIYGCMFHSAWFSLTIVIVATIQGTLLWALKMVLENTQKTMNICNQLQSQLCEIKNLNNKVDVVQKYQTNLQDANGILGEPNPEATKVVNGTVVKPIVLENGLITCPKCQRRQQANRTYCYSCGAQFDLSSGEL